MNKLLIWSRVPYHNHCPCRFCYHRPNKYHPKRFPFPTLHLRQNLICPPASCLYLRELLKILQTVSSNEQIFSEVGVSSEQLFTEVEMDILGFSPTLRWIITAYTNQWISEVKNCNLCIFMSYFEFVNKLGSWKLLCVSVKISASLLKLRRRIILKNKPYLGKHPNQISLLSLYWLGWFKFAQTFRKPGRNVISFVCRHASMEYPRIFLDREPIGTRKRHHSLVRYMLMSNYSPKWRWIDQDIHRAANAARRI